MIECYAALKKEWEIVAGTDLSELEVILLHEKNKIIVTFYKKEEKIRMSIYRKDKWQTNKRVYLK